MIRPIEQERRASPRIEINGELTYCKAGSGRLHRGMLENMSLGGARIWLGEELPTSSRVNIRVDSEIDEGSLEFVATLLHRLPQRRRSLYGYGCTIDPVDKFLN